MKTQILSTLELKPVNPKLETYTPKPVNQNFETTTYSKNLEPKIDFENLRNQTVTSFEQKKDVNQEQKEVIEDKKVDLKEKKEVKKVKVIKKKSSFV